MAHGSGRPRVRFALGSMAAPCGQPGGSNADGSPCNGDERLPAPDETDATDEDEGRLVGGGAVALAAGRVAIFLHEAALLSMDNP